jgi:predicted DNA-binding transcriptional regulator AlpA
VQTDCVLKLHDVVLDAGLPPTAARQDQLERSASSERATLKPVPGSSFQTLFWSGQQLAKALGISLASFHRYRVANRIGPKPVRLGGRVLYSVKECIAWAESRTHDSRLPDRREWDAMQSSKKSR